MVRQTNVLQEFEESTKRAIKKIGGNLIIRYNNCRHALLLSHGVYCTLRREKMGGHTCEGCAHFDSEPLEYRLFRRR